jgi:ankyrin repeat protein
MLYSARNPENELEHLRDRILATITQVSGNAPGPSSSGIPYFRYIYFCLVQFLCPRNEIIEMIAHLVTDFPGYTTQIAYVSSWFLRDIEKYAPEMFASVTEIIKGTKFLDGTIPICHKFTGLNELPDLIDCVFPPDSVGDAIRTDNMDLLARLANESSFDVNAKMPPAFFGCYSMWKDEPPSLIEGAAFFGSVNVFKYLVLNGALPAAEPGESMPLVSWVIAGGSLELLRFCIEREYDLVDALPVAVRYHQYSITVWISGRYLPELVEDGLDALGDEALKYATEAVESENLVFLTKPPRPDDSLCTILLHIAARAGRLHSFRFLAHTVRNWEAPIVSAAIESGSVSILSRVITKVKANKLGDAMTVAARIGRTDLLDYLLRAKAPVELRALLTACEHGHSGLALALLKAKAPADPTAVETAIKHGRRAVVATLLAWGIKAPENALEIAIRGGHLDVLQLLVDSGVPVDDTALRVAAQAGLAGAVAIIRNIATVDVNGRDDKQLSALHWAVKKQDKEIVKLLIDTVHIDVIARDSRRRMPTHYAAAGGSPDILTLLLETPLADVNSQDSEGKTPLHLAAEEGETTCVRAILARPDVDVNITDNSRRTPLHLAVQQNRRDAVKCLIARDDIRANARDDTGKTPLHVAADRGLYEIAFILVRSGKVSFLERTNTGWTALHFAAKGGHDDVLSLLMPTSRDVWNAGTTDAFTALHLACMGKHLEAVQVLIEQEGVDANAETRTGVSFSFSRPAYTSPPCMVSSMVSNYFLPVARSTRMPKHQVEFFFFAFETT